MRTKLLLALVLCLPACAELPQVPEIPKQAIDAVENASVFAESMRPITDACAKPDALPEFCKPFLAAESKLEQAIVRAKRALIAGETAQDALVQVRSAMVDVVNALSTVEVDGADAGSP